MIAITIIIIIVIVIVIALYIKTLLTLCGTLCYVMQPVRRAPCR
jgi:hypothetical protein